MRTARARVATWLLVILTVTQACGDGEPSAGESPTTASSGTAGDPGPIPVLRLGDEGAETELAVGGTASVMLPTTYEWGEPVVEGNAVTVSQDISDEGSGSRSWTVTARQEGTASLTLTGSPTCRSETPSCAAPDISWTAGFTVL